MKNKNDYIYENSRKRRLFLSLIIIFGLITLSLSIISLITNNLFVLLGAIVSFIVEYICSIKFNKLKSSK